jgi:hypothetical protein
VEELFSEAGNSPDPTLHAYYILLAMTCRCSRARLARMLDPCTECGHTLWSEVRRHGAYRFVVHFDDERRSDSYAEHVLACPGCGGGLSLQAWNATGSPSGPGCGTLGCP